MIAIQRGQIHPTAIIGENVKIGKSVTIGAHCVVYDNVVLEDNVVIGPNSSIGEPLAEYYYDQSYKNPELVIGKDSLLRSNAVIYAGSIISHHFQCGHRVTIRENTKIGNNCRIGTLSDIQGHSQFGEYVQLHSNVHIGQKSVIGNFVWLFPYVVLTNDPHPPSNFLFGVAIEDFAIVATMSVIMPGVKIGQDALVGAHTLVRKDIPAEMVVVGNPGKEITNVRSIKSKETGEEVYPWRYHFDRGMPWQGIGYDNWKNKQAT
jgi:acetyltransferase-like isoleucine patch superfamily enzyme